MTMCKNCGHDIYLNGKEEPLGDENGTIEFWVHRDSDCIKSPYIGCVDRDCGCTSPEPLTEADRWADEQLEQQKEDRLVGVLP